MPGSSTLPARSTRRPGTGRTGCEARRSGRTVSSGTRCATPAVPTLVLFGDRLAAAFGQDYERVLLHEVPELAVYLDDKAGRDWLNGMLAKYRVAIESPPPDRDR